MSEIVEAHDQNIGPKQSLSEILRPPAVSDLSTKCSSAKMASNNSATAGFYTQWCL